MKNLLKWVLGRIAGGWQINGLLKSVVRFMLRTIARKVVIELLASLCAMQIRPFNGNNNANDRLPGLLVLSPERFGKDLEALAGTGRFRILLSPVNWQMGLFSLFFPTGLTNRQLASHQGDPELEACQRSYREFLEVFLARIFRAKKINCVIGANFWYHQDIHWGAVAKAIGVPYVVFFKECFRTQERDQQWIVDNCCRLGGTFEGTLLTTHNDLIRGLLINCNYVDKKNSQTVGIPRMDEFVRRLPNLPKRIDPSENPFVTLFSFNPGIGLGEKGIPPWPGDEKKGWADLFQKVHAGFASLAIHHPEKTFIIKPKWGGKWIERIESAIAEIGENFSEIPNLKIVLDKNAHDLIEKSQVVCCFNSSTMLEAAVTKRAVIVPHFEDAIPEEFAGFVKFRDRDDLFEIARSQEEMIDLISQRLRVYEVDSQIQEARNLEFEKWLSGLNGTATEKWCEAIEAVI
jgi:hypothetical protein